MAKTQSFGFTGIWRSCYLLALIGTSVWAANCDEFEWRCQNGQCISEDEKCDGAVHCADGSDETAEFCYGKVACPEFAFQCTYGACVSGKAKCNGIRDCADGSDEFPRLCNKTISSGKCQRGHFQCDNKEQCILSEEACDGSKHCKDGSDETEENCAFLPCPPYSFRCRYGACVKGGAKCNGVNECADGSDEVSCPGSKITTAIRPNSTTTSNDVGLALGTGCRVSVSSGMIVRPPYDDNDKLRDGSDEFPRLCNKTISSGNCQRGHFQCDNKEQCILSEEACDGSKHCKDGSDETEENCAFLPCPPYSFRCRYGACVKGGAKCNGVNECADGSDEVSCPGSKITTAIRPNSTTTSNDVGLALGTGCRVSVSSGMIVRPPYDDNDKLRDGSDEFPRLCNKTISSGNCQRGHFQCDNKEQCILSEEACDGSKHCKDGSDETEENCAFLPCPPYSFRCRYGACVKGGAKCNGVNECADGSDEVSCPGSKITTAIRPNSTTTSNDVGLALGTGCRVSVSSGMIVRPPYDDNDKLRDGDRVENFGGVNYECEPGLYLFHDKILVTKNFCLNGTWVSPVPECLRVCKRLDAVTYKATYFFNFETLDDNALLRPGTRASITCAVGYREQLGITAEQKNLKCLRTGEWSPSPWPCSPKCGIIQPNAIVYSTELGSEVTNKNIPWHVGLFKRNADSRWENICGGSIISTKLIITAAHCLSKTVSVVDYMVVAGKYYRDYYKREPETQDFNVSEIHIPDTYVDLHKQYSNDIGLVILNKHIRYRSHIAPVCYNWEPFDKWELPPGTKGRTVGWGAIRDDVYSDELRSIELPVLSKEECLKKVTKTYEDYVNIEKFCVGSPGGGGSLCKGDSGGGFAITKTIDNRTVYFLWGILSVALDKEQRCHAENYVTFTNIQNHKDLIISYEHKFRPDTT